MIMWSCEDRDAPFVGVFRRTATRAGYDVRILHPAAEPAGFTELKRHYRHLSPNAERFELASFRRWFEIAANVTPTDRFVLADSDLVVQDGFSALPAELRETTALVGSIGSTDDVLEDGINGGFSIWTGATLHAFCDYMVALYASDFDRLARIHAAKTAAGNPRASISDMTLLYQFVADTNTAFVNSNRVINGGYIDHNFFMPHCLGTRFRTTLGRKSLRFAADGFWLTTENGTPVRPHSLHLGGRYKIMATAIETADSLTLTRHSAYIVAGRTARTLLGKVGIHR